MIISCRSQSSSSLRRGSGAAGLLGLWFVIQSGHGSLSLVHAVCCQIEVSATGRALFQRNPTECGTSDCDSEASIR